MIPGQKLTREPTARMVLDMLDTARVAYVEHEGMVRRLWRSTSRLFDVPRLLWLAGFGKEIYTDPALDDRLVPSSGNHWLAESTCGMSVSASQSATIRLRLSSSPMPGLHGGLIVL
jgi:hypothetical protein